MHIIERPAGSAPPSHPSAGAASPASPSSPASCLSSSSSSSDGEDGATLRINRAYAERFESTKRAEELSKKAQRGRRASEIRALLNDHLARSPPSHAADGSQEDNEDEGEQTEEEEEEEEEEDEDEEEDDEGALLTEELDVRIHETLNAIRRRDPAVYDRSNVFFSDDPALAPAPAAAAAAAKEGKKVTVKDLLLQSLAEDAEDGEDEEEDSAEEGGERPLTHVEEQAALKRALVTAARTAGNDDDSDEELFRVRITAPPAPASSSAPSSPPLPPAQFLHAFLSQQWWKAPASSLPSYAAIKGEAPPPLLHGDSDDDREVERGEQFEAQYNFRYQERGGTEVHTWPRAIPDSLRRSDDRRKAERERRRLRKEDERRRRDDEVKKAKREKLRQLEERVNAVHAVAGLSTAVDDLGLDEAFDDAAHDRLMARMFGDEYYAAAGEDDEDAIARIARDVDEDGEEGKGEVQKGPLAYAGEAAKEMRRGMDEVYALDYEDIVGGVPTRFHYRPVKADTFGLSLADILDREDRELNARISIKKMAPYREEEEGGETEEQLGVKGKPRGREKKRSAWTKGGPGQKHAARKAGKGRLPGDSKAPAKSNAKAAGIATVFNGERTAPPPVPVKSGEEAPGDGQLSSAQRRRLREKKRKALQATATLPTSSTPAKRAKI